jgi:regulator of replication initiation timing
MAEDFRSLGKEALQTAQGIKNAVGEIIESNKTLVSELGKGETRLSNLSTQYNSIKNSANDLVRVQEMVTQRAKGTSEAIKYQNKLLGDVKNINAEIYNLYASSLVVKGKEKIVLMELAKNAAALRDNAKDLANEYKSLAEDSAKLDRRTQFFSSLSEVARDIPGLRKLSEPFNAAAESARKAVIYNAEIDGGLNATGKKTNIMMAGLKGGFKALGPMISGIFAPIAIIGILIKGIKALVSMMAGASAQTAELSKNLLISRDAARDLRQSAYNLQYQYNVIAEVNNRNVILQQDIIYAKNIINKSL